MNTLRNLLALGALLLFAPSCTTEAFCFADCAGSSGTGGSGGDGGGTSVDSGPIFPEAGTGGCTGFGCGSGGSTADTGPVCEKTNAGVEICDGVDNDCDGQIDEAGTPPDGIDFADPRRCGTCNFDCTDPQNNLKNVVTPTCTPPAAADLGKKPGTCDYDECAPNTYDIDGKRSNGCEYACPWNPDGTKTVDEGGAFGCGKDDDCNGKVDDGLNFCSDPENCGSCGFKCSLTNAESGKCVTTAAQGEACTSANTSCVVEKCLPNFWDVDQIPDNGCEYPCTPTNPPTEVCDGIDNDCDRKVDNEDDDLETGGTVGGDCSGGDKGICLTNKGLTKCIDGALTCCDVSSNTVDGTNPRYPVNGIRNDVCVGNATPHVVRPGQRAETCNDVDDDCDGAVDGATTDSGGICGSSVGTCQLGHYACIGGQLVCPDATGPNPDGETCDGKDNDCDGVIDGTEPASSVACTADADCTTAPYLFCRPDSTPTAGKSKICVAAPTDIADPNSGARLVCGVTPAPPPGATQPCRPGTMACFGGTPVCQGNVAKPSDFDRCGDDTNCDGVLSNQTGLSNADVKNCGSCGNDCTTAAPQAQWECQAGACVRTGCSAGFIECGGADANDCETACTFQSSTEVCDGKDNDCDCQVDEPNVDASGNPVPITPPSPIQACGVASSATDPGCNAQVALKCENGGWTCTFTDPAYCSTGNCATTPDICDGKDNNCDGVIDEGFRPPALLVGFLGQGCFSDDGKPAPGDGPCRTQGTFVCAANGQSTVCSATKDLTKVTAEKCDGIDNNCNGAVDDNLNDPALNKQCFGGTLGECADVSHAGLTACVLGAVSCTGNNVLKPGAKLEVCDGKDNDCNGTPDDNLTDTGGVCGSGVGECKTGTRQCITGALQCTNAKGPTPEVCDGKDNDCDGAIDDTPTDVGTACDVPPPPPNGATSPCKAGAVVCVGGQPLCQGSIKPVSTTDNCGEDANCNGVLTNQTNLQNNDVQNCGACGNDCNTLDPTGNSVFACNAGVCVRTGCKDGFIDCDGNANTCERACTRTSLNETCDGKDNDCNCQIDDNPVPVNSVQVCGVSPAATDVGCTTGVQTVCTAGAWKCTFPSGYCTGGNCATMTEACDGKDNNCNGATDETFKAPILATGFLGQTCTTPATDGPCQGTGVYVCNGGGTATTCNAVKDNTKSSAEKCDGIDNNCNGTVDDNPTDAQLGTACYGGQYGECAAAAHAGSYSCQSGAIVCTGANLLKPGQQAEVCNGKDDDCDQSVDETPTDVGGPCGSGVGACVPGSYICQNGAKVCQGGITASSEICDGIDNNCDGTVDNSPSGVGAACNVPLPTPAATAQCPAPTTVCKAGTVACTSGLSVCQGSVTASPSTPDGCCVDANCDGQLTNQPDFLTDVKNCGGCGNDCNVLNAGKHGVWACVAGACQRTACAVGYINCDAVAGDCERACTFSGTELCNGVDDNCDCSIDNNVASVPTPTQVCGVSASASDPLCLPGNGTNGVAVACNAGAWKCTFPAGYCNGTTPGDCSTTTDICDSKDNNCNGATDENYKPPVKTSGYLGQACASDDGKPPPGDGQCRTTGSFVCDTTTTTKCSAVKDSNLAGAENCDGVDNDCDGSVDEPFSAKGTNATYFVKPDVVQVGAQWVFKYEASRPNASASSPGSGNGLWCSGTQLPNGGGTCSGSAGPNNTDPTLDKTRACSAQNKIPWFNVNPIEAEQTCQAMGGSLCSTTQWTTSCQAGASCKWSYNGACTTTADYTNGPYCNLGPYDFDLVAGAPNSDGLLPTASSLLKSCQTSTGLFDITGNLRELTKRAANDYPLMGGAFNTMSEDGASCSFDFYSVSTSFKFYDTGFRCCFSSNPTL